MVAAEEDKILFPKTDGSKGSFCSVIIKLCQAIITVLEMLAQGRVDGSWLKHLKQLQKTQVLILDDLGLEPLPNTQCNDLLEIIEDRYGQSSTIVVSQFPVDKWHRLMENPTMSTADAILDRLEHNAHRVVLQGAVNEEK